MTKSVTLLVALVAMPAVLGIPLLSPDLQIIYSNWTLAAPREFVANASWTYNPKPIFNIFPLDLGGNFGDLIHLKRGPAPSNDFKLYESVFVNENTYSKNVKALIMGRFAYYEITQIQALNLGRQRGYVTSIYSGEDGSFGVEVLIKSKDQVRLLIQVYGQ